MLSGPTLLSQGVTSTSASTSIYTLDPSTGVGVDPASYQSVTLRTAFGPALVNAAVALAPGQGSNPVNAGIYSVCNVQTLPSCSAVDGGTLFVLAGQTEVKAFSTFTYLIDTATTVTTTTTQTQVYAVDGTRAGGLARVRAGPSRNGAGRAATGQAR